MMSCHVVSQENRQLKKELREVEIEVNRLKRQAHAEVQEEMKIKVDTQTQLLSILSEHNRALQLQVCVLVLWQLSHCCCDTVTLFWWHLR